MIRIAMKQNLNTLLVSKILKKRNQKTIYDPIDYKLFFYMLRILHK
jgi:hypothetical protein